MCGSVIVLYSVCVRSAGRLCIRNLILFDTMCQNKWECVVLFCSFFFHVLKRGCSRKGEGDLVDIFQR